MREGMSLADEMRSVMKKAILKKELYAETIAAPYYYKLALKDIRKKAENGIGSIYFDPNRRNYPYFKDIFRPDYSPYATDKIIEMLKKDGFTTHFSKAYTAIFIQWGDGGEE
jgi:hypothetical protein